MDYNDKCKSTPHTLVIFFQRFLFLTNSLIFFFACPFRKSIEHFYIYYHTERLFGNWESQASYSLGLPSELGSKLRTSMILLFERPLYPDFKNEECDLFVIFGKLQISLLEYLNHNEFECRFQQRFKKSAGHLIRIRGPYLDVVIESRGRNEFNYFS